MKKFLTLVLTIAITSSVFSQSASFTATMQKYVAQLDTATNATTMQDMANKFERIAAAESKEWLPDYYAALCYLTMSFMQTDVSKIDALVDKADVLLKAALKINANESEIYVLMGMSAAAKIMVDPMTRGMQYGTLSGSYYDKALGLNVDNPRAYLLKAQSTAYTPEQWGGGPLKAEPMLNKALEKFAKDEPSTSILPHWGKDQADKLAGWIAEEKNKTPGENTPSDNSND